MRDVENTLRYLRDPQSLALRRHTPTFVRDIAGGTLPGAVTPVQAIVELRSTPRIAVLNCDFGVGILRGWAEAATALLDRTNAAMNYMDR
jgi:hypothetical protein